MPSRRKITYSNRPSHAARSAHARGERQFRTYDTSHIRPKKSKGPLVFSIVLVLVVIGLLVWGATTLLNGCSATLAEGETAQITIADGSGAKTIGTQLQEAGVIANANEFATRVAETGADASLKSGVYTFSGGMTLDQVINQLKAGSNVLVATFTIPEGYKAEQVASKVAEAYPGSISTDDFLDVARDARAYENDYPFVAEAYDNSLEGFLFPKTYEVISGATADTVVRQMLDQYRTETASLDYSYAESQGLSKYDVLILASIVEKEATSNNRATVASVFYNRLEIDMALQSDATTAYVIGEDPRPEDLRVEGPYNTYLNKGLSAGPICSPGISCLQAVCSPEMTDYYYFYFEDKDGDGSLEYFFSETYDEHNEAIHS